MPDPAVHSPLLLPPHTPDVSVVGGETAQYALASPSGVLQTPPHPMHPTAGLPKCLGSECVDPNCPEQPLVVASPPPIPPPPPRSTLQLPDYMELLQQNQRLQKLLQS